jgi:hypothetical protein
MPRDNRLGLATIMSLLVLSACAELAELPVERNRETIAATQGDHDKLVVVLAEISDTVGELKRAGIAEAIQRGMPDADVELIAMPLPFTSKGQPANNIHNDIVQPAKSRGYREIYLAGVSKGALEAIMYEREHRGEIQGLVLISPVIGKDALINEIEDAGRLSTWNPGALPREIDRHAAPREAWRHMKSWIGDRARTRNVWLICGQDDPASPTAKIIADVLPRRNVVFLPGNRDWKAWTQGTAEAFAVIAEDRIRIARRE